MTQIAVCARAAAPEIRDAKRQSAFERNRKLACWVFVAGYFFVNWHGAGSRLYTLPGLQYLELPLFAWLFLLTWLKRGGRAASQTLKVLWVTTLLAIPLFWLYGDNPSDGGEGAYLKQAILYIFYVGFVAGFAYTFYREGLFVDIWLKAATVAAVIALLGYALAVTTGRPDLVTFANYSGGLRLTGMLGEPSSWAPIISAGILLSWRRRSPRLVVMFAAAGLLTKSPTVALAFVLSLAVVLLISRFALFLKFMIVMLLAGAAPWIIPVFTGGVAPVDRNSGNPLAIMMGRLLSGIEFVQTGGASGSNVRAEGALKTWSILESHDWLWVGRGLGSADVYFPFHFGTVQAWSLPVNLLFSFGVIGLGVYVLFALLAIWNMRNTEAALIFIPFLMASAINSAQGIEFYKFALLGILLYVGRTGRSNRLAKRWTIAHPWKLARVSRLAPDTE
ncbi:MAG: hypothetical protein HHJ10_06185 [Cellulomonas sp.]|uniref:hypothetical protein n=1 Tax=Cellulomonas sp. TaxID=40001 RepID=UPI0017D94F7A|nr:hypothetical protein [Cellulomonas sp.]NMM30625.1 hypothetical protein [Cellulomonas sp.]